MTKKFFGKVLIIVVFFCMLMTYCGKSNSSHPTKFDYQASKEGLKIDLFIPNLKESAAYVLCLNGKFGQNGNEALCDSGGKIFGTTCYIDFHTVLSDQNGNLSYTGTVSLKSSTYDVTFLIKDKDNTEKPYNPVFMWDCKFVIP